MSRLVGVDLGATEVRVVEVAGLDSTGRAIITRMGFSPLREGVISSGRIRNPQAVALAMRHAFKEAGVSRQGVVLGLASPDVAMTWLALPAAVKRAEREAVIRLNEEDISPTVDLEQSAISTQKISTEVDEGSAMTTLSVAAVLDSEVRTLQNVCTLARCQPRAIDLSGAALLRALTRANEDNDEIATVVDLGASKITVATRVGLHMRSVRTISGGGYEVSRSLMSVTDEDFATTEERKLTMKLAPSSASAGPVINYGFGEEVEQDRARAFERSVQDALASGVDVMVDSVAQIIESDAASIGEYTRGITIVGGTSRLRGVKERLQQRVGVPVQIGKPWVHVERSKRNAGHIEETREDPARIMDITTAVGLALWKEPS